MLRMIPRCEKPEAAQGFSDPQSRERALLQTWFSPSFPIGGFAYSQGLESATEAGLVADETALLAWIGDLFLFGSASNDLIFAASAWKAVTARDWAGLNAVADFAVALQPSAERHLEAVTQGGSFINAIRDAWPCPALVEALGHCGDQARITYFVAAGLVPAAHGLRLGPTLEAVALSFASNQISAAIRLGTIGHTAGQRVIGMLLPVICDVSGRASIATLDDIGSACFSADLLTLEHETLYTRLFRT